MTQTHRIWVLAEAVIHKAGAEGLMIASAESCTGGRLSAALTEVPGSSAVFERGFVVYSNAAKTELLGVGASIIHEHGAVSAAVALAMARGAVANSHADLAVSVTGIAGPDGGNAEKPVGLVWFGIATRNAPARAERRVFAHGSRDFVRTRAVETALQIALAALNA